MSNIWYLNANNVQDYLQKPECILDIMKTIGWTFYKSKKSALLDHNYCDLVANRYGALEFIDLDQILQPQAYENFVLCTVEAGPFGFNVTDHTCSLPAIFLPKLHPLTMGGPHLILLKQFTFTTNRILEITLYILLTPFVTPPMPPSSTSYTLDAIYSRQVYNSPIGHTHLISGKYPKGTIYIRFRQEFIHISKVISGSIKIYAPSSSLTLIDPDITLDWTDTCTFESIEIETPIPPSTSISRVLGNCLVTSAIQDLVTISVKIQTLTKKLEGYVITVSDHPSSTLKVFIDQNHVHSNGLRKGLSCLFQNLMVSVVNGQISGIFKTSSSLTIVDDIVVSNELVVENRDVQLLAVIFTKKDVGNTWISVYPVTVLSLHLHYQCLGCDTILDCDRCECGEEVVLEGEAEIIVQDGSMEVVLILPNFNLIQRVFGFDITRLKNRCGFGKVSLTFLGNLNAPVDDQDWLIEYCRAGTWMDRFKFRVTSIPGYLSCLFDPESPGNIIKSEFLKPKTFKDLEGESQISMALKFVKIHVGQVESIDSVQEAFSILNSM